MIKNLKNAIWQFAYFLFKPSNDIFGKYKPFKGLIKKRQTVKWHLSECTFLGFLILYAVNIFDTLLLDILLNMFQIICSEWRVQNWNWDFFFTFIYKPKTMQIIDTQRFKIHERVYVVFGLFLSKGPIVLVLKDWGCPFLGFIAYLLTSLKKNY